MSRNRSPVGRPEPPEFLERELESGVMDYVETHAPSRRARSRTLTAAALGLVCLLLLVLVSRETVREETEWTNCDFVESRIILDDHVSIWLTPVAEGKEGERTP